MAEFVTYMMWYVDGRTCWGGHQRKQCRLQQNSMIYIGYSMGNLADTGYMVLYIGQQEGITIGNITFVTITLAGSSSSCAVNLVNDFYRARCSVTQIPIKRCLLCTILNVIHQDSCYLEEDCETGWTRK